MLTAEATLLEARRQLAALVAQAASQRVTLLLSVGGGFNTQMAQTDTNSKQGAMP
jgi:outer membrane protein TolC